MGGSIGGLASYGTGRHRLDFTNQFICEKFLSCICPGQTDILVNNRIRRNTMIYLRLYHDRVSVCRIWRNMAVQGEENDRISSLYKEPVNDLSFTSCFSVYDRFSVYTVTKIYVHNTSTGNTTNYGRILPEKKSKHIQPLTAVYGIHKLRSGQLFMMNPVLICCAVTLLVCANACLTVFYYC